MNELAVIADFIKPYYQAEVNLGAFGLIVAGGARHIGDWTNGRPENYSRGEMPCGVLVESDEVWVGNEMHGYKGARVVTRCFDGVWLSNPQPTHQGDWVSRKISD